MMWLMLGCVRRGEVPYLAPRPPPAASSAIGGLVGPMRWSEGPRGLCWNVPEGWVGTADRGPEVSLAHTETHVVARLGATRWPGEPLTDPIEAVRVFEDAGSFRTIPMLFPAATATWRGSEGSGPTTFRWWGRVGERRVWVEIVAPDGTLLRDDVVGAVLDGLCRDQ